MFPEMRILRAGYQVMQQEQHDQQRGVSPGDREGLSEFAQNVDDTESWAQYEQGTTNGRPTH